MKLLPVLMLALVLVAPAGAGTRLPALEQTASEIAGRPVVVTCRHLDEWPDAYGWQETHASGYYNWDRGEIVLAPRTCVFLLLLYVDTEGSRVAALNPSLSVRANAASALLTLVHEAIHAAGVHDEGETECRAHRMVDEVAYRVGVPRTDDAFVAHLIAAHERKTGEYRSVC